MTCLRNSTSAKNMAKINIKLVCRFINGETCLIAWLDYYDCSSNQIKSSQVLLGYHIIGHDYMTRNRRERRKITWLVLMLLMETFWSANAYLLISMLIVKWYKCLSSLWRKNRQSATACNINERRCFCKIIFVRIWNKCRHLLSLYISHMCSCKSAHSITKW